VNFRRRRLEEPEINLIPFIDVLLVVLIFLMLSTTFNQLTQVQITLPTANTEKQNTTPETLTLTIQADGRYSLNQQAIKATTVADIQAALQAAQISPKTVLVIAADQNVRHQSVISAMEAARRSGLNRVTFASQSSVTANKQAADKRNTAK
jgi:biopolymer transport protein ExbD